MTKPKHNKPIPRMASVDTLVKLAREGEDGRLWYQSARQNAEAAAAYYNLPLWQYADYLSLFSPRVSVRRSIRIAHYYIEHGQFHPTTMKSVRVSVEHYENTAEIRGPKTGPFSRALLGDERAVVLDVWMAYALGIDQKQFSRPAVHARAVGRVNQAALRLGWTPAQVQAAVWTAAVRNAGRTPTAFETGVNSLFGWTPERVNP